MKKKKMSKEEIREFEALLKQMKKFEKKGVDITLQGANIPLKDIAEACVVKERGSYMGDYIWDDHGNLQEIRYDKVEQPD